MKILPKTEADIRRYFKELEERRLPEWALITAASSARPPSEGLLIPITSYDADRLRESFFSSFQMALHGEKEAFIPAIAIRIDGGYKTTFQNARVTFTADLIPESTVLNFCVVVASKQPWVTKLWEKNWRILSARPSDEGDIPEPISCLEYWDAPKRRVATISTAQKKFLAIMLLHDFWSRHQDTGESFNADLRALGLASAKSDRTTFANDLARADCYLLNCKPLTYAAWLGC